MATKKPPAKKVHMWEIVLIRERGRFLGYVEAPDEKAAIEDVGVIIAIAMAPD
jgi:hypothetical protein